MQVEACFIIGAFMSAFLLLVWILQGWGVTLETLVYQASALLLSCIPSLSFSFSSLPLLHVSSVGYLVMAPH